MKRLLLFLFFFPVCAYDFYGTHYTASYYGIAPTKLEDQLHLMPYFIKAIGESGATVLRISKHTFDNGSVTATALLSESHAAFHTYPEHGTVFIDLFTCGTNCDWKKFENVMVSYFKPTKIRRKVRSRN